MTIPDPSADDSGRGFARAALWLSRLAGLALFALGILYWVRIVGAFPGPDWRFDLMRIEWRAAAPTLAVLYPVAGVGLWLAAPWGLVVWVLAAALVASLRLGVPDAFAALDPELVFHAAGLVLFAGLRLGAWLARRRRRASRRRG